MRHKRDGKNPRLEGASEVIQPTPLFAAGIQFQIPGHLCHPRQRQGVEEEARKEETLGQYSLTLIHVPSLYPSVKFC